MKILKSPVIKRKDSRAFFNGKIDESIGKPNVQEYELDSQIKVD